MTDVSQATERLPISALRGAPESATRTPRLRALCGSSFAILSGDDATALDLLLAGGDGVISVTANVAPQEMHDMVALARAGDATGSQRVDARLRPVHESLFVESNPIPLKWALSELGLIQPGIRLPLTPLSERHHATVRRALRSANLQ